MFQGYSLAPLLFLCRTCLVCLLVGASVCGRSVLETLVSCLSRASVNTSRSSVGRRGCQTSNARAVYARTSLSHCWGQFHGLLSHLGGHLGSQEHCARFCFPFARTGTSQAVPHRTNVAFVAPFPPSPDSLELDFPSYSSSRSRHGEFLPACTVLLPVVSLSEVSYLW